MKHKKPLRMLVWKNQNKRCYWCGCPTEFYNHVHGVATRPDAATVDHVYPAWHPMRKRHKANGSPSPFVISCHSCNNKRGGISFKKYHELIGKPFLSHVHPKHKESYE